MTHRCTIERRGGTVDELGARTTNGWADHVTEVPCRCYWKSGLLEAQPSNTTPIGALILIVPVGTDVDVLQDRVGDVTDRRGRVLFAGPMQIIGPVGHRQDHLTLGLKAT